MFLEMWNSKVSKRGGVGGYDVVTDDGEGKEAGVVTT